MNRGMYRGVRVSILVFVDLALEVIDEIDARGCQVKFQSLFSWIWLSKCLVLQLGHQISLGFNPCFRGSGSRSSTIPTTQGQNQGFNPCFRGSGSRSVYLDLRYKVSYDVSILVFVDLALEEDHKYGNDSLHK